MMEETNLHYYIRSEKKEDYDQIREVNIIAFDNRDNEAKLVESIRQSEFFIPELSLVAVKGNEIIGHILFSQIAVETKSGNVPTIGLAPMAVKPSYQNNGVGSKLVSEGIARCKSLGYKHVIVLGHPNFYPRFGFIPSKSFGIFSPFPVPEEVFMVLELEEGTLKDLKGTVKYPPAFNSVS